MSGRAITSAQKPGVAEALLPTESKARRGGQRSLIVGPGNDPLEREADQAADLAMSGRGGAQVTYGSPPLLRRAEPSIGRHILMPASVDQELASPGVPLQADIRGEMTRKFGYDFSHVRVHTGCLAERSAGDVDANAYTVGDHVVFGSGQFSPTTTQGRRLISHELAHVVQQSSRPNAGPANEHQSSSNRSAAAVLQRQEKTATPATAKETPPSGDAVRPEVEALLKSFASASSDEAKNAIAKQAVNLVIRAYNMSTRGLRGMRYNSKLNPKYAAFTTAADGSPRESEIEFGPDTFNSGFETFVHVVAHELEHVAQILIGIPRSGAEEDPVWEFRAYNASVLQVQNVVGPPNRGLLGAMSAEARKPSPSLPPLPPDKLAYEAKRALEKFSLMQLADQNKYRADLAASRDKLLERLANEAPPLLRPPAKGTPAWTQWYADTPPDDPFTMEYQDWLTSRQSPWMKVKDIWKEIDKAIPAGSASAGSGKP
jgi:hypothetical protein